MRDASRRQFLRSTAAAGAAIVAAPAIARGRPSANDRIRIGLLGLGGRMQAHIRALSELASQDVEIAAVCDCDESKLASVGKVYLDYSSYYTFLGPDGEPGPSRAEAGQPMADRPHFENWLVAIRSRDHGDLAADIGEGHKSMTPCLLARTAYQVGRCLNFDPTTETVIGDEEANALLNEPTYRTPYVVPREV